MARESQAHWQKTGADVAVNFRERADAATAVCDKITGTGRKAIAVQADVIGCCQRERMVAEVEAKLGGIDIFVNNPAIAHPCKLEKMTEAEWGEVLTVNLKSVFLVTQLLRRPGVYLDVRSLCVVQTSKVRSSWGP